MQIIDIRVRSTNSRNFPPQNVGAAEKEVELPGAAHSRAKERCLSRFTPPGVPKHPSGAGLFNIFPRHLLPNLTQIAFQMDEERNSIIQTQTIVSLSKVITAKAMQQCLMFIYTGSIEPELLQLEVIY